VKSISHILLLYTKSVTDYNVLLAEIQTTKLAYHTYPLPDVIQPNMVLKGIPPNVPVDKIQADLTAQELWVVKISHIMKTDKATQTLITKYPVFVVTLQTGTDVSEIQQIKKLCHIIQWEKYKNNKSVCQCFNCQSFDHSCNFCGKPPKCVKCNQPRAMQECKQNIGTPPKCVNCGRAHPANFTDCPSYQQFNLHQRQLCLLKLTTPAFQFKQAHFPALKLLTSPLQQHKTWAQTASQTTTPTDRQSLNSIML